MSARGDFRPRSVHDKTEMKGCGTVLIAYKHDEDQILQEVVPEAAEKGSWLNVVHPTEEE